jgi:hypothetical protein
MKSLGEIGKTMKIDNFIMINFHSLRVGRVKKWK